MTELQLSWLQRLPCRSLGFGIAGLLLLATLCLAVLEVCPSALRRIIPPPIRHHGPWVIGRADARFTIVEYADLECPYCRAYFPVLERWINDHPQVNLEWWNLPLAMHDPVASREATLAECIGEVDGNRAFWQAVAWIYGHTRSNGAGIAAGTPTAGMSSAVRTCLETPRAEAVIRAQATEASRQHVVGTPTLEVLDHRTGRALELQGPVADTSLLSAIDWLSAPIPGQTPRPRAESP